MSFLLDPPLLFAAGEAYARGAPESAQGRAAAVAGAAVAGGFLAVSIPLWLEHGWTAPLWRAFGARGGRDFMVGSGIVSRRRRRFGTREHVLAGLAFATYPLWFRAGWDHGRRARPRRRRS